MKRIFLFLLAYSWLAASYAQGSGITGYVNGFVRTENSIYSTYGNKTTIAGINPGLGYQLSSTVSVGLQGGYDQYKTAAGISNSSNITIHDWTAGLFCRYTKYTAGWLFVFAQADIGYAGGNASQQELGAQGSYSGDAAAIYPGLGVSIRKKLACIFSVGGFSYYNHEWINNTAGFKNYNTGAITFGRVFQLGVCINFAGKEHRQKKETVIKTD